MILTEAIVECARGLTGEARKIALATGLYGGIIVENEEKQKERRPREPGEDDA